jgi:putative ABC transport system permease protein
MKHLKLISRSVRRHLRSSLLTSMTLALAAFLFAVLVSVPASIDRIIKEASQTLRLVISNRTGPWYDLPPRYCDQIGQIPGVVACVAVTGWPATYRSVSDAIVAFAMTDGRGFVFPDYGVSEETYREFYRSKRGAMAGSLLMRKNGWKVGDQFTLKSTRFDQLQLSFTLVGEIPSRRYPTTFVFQRDYLTDSHRAAGFADPGLAWFLLARVNSAEQVMRVARQIDETFRNSDYETRTTTEANAISVQLNSVGNIRGIIYGLCAVVIFTVLLIAGNATAIIVRDRLAEVAVLRVLGFGSPTVAAVLLGESASLGLMGGLFGAMTALAIFGRGVSLGVAMGAGGYLIVPVGVAAEAVGVAVLVSVASATLPVLAALKVSPAAAFTQIV